MKIDLSEALTAVLPWELTLTINGVSYATRRPTLALNAMLMRLPQLSDAQRKTAIAAMLVLTPVPAAKEGDPPTVPDVVGAWDFETFTAAAVAYSAYGSEQLAKNSPAIAAKIKAAMATGQAPAM